MLTLLNKLLKAAFPYLLIAALGLWATSLQNRVNILEYENESLISQMAQQEIASKATEKALKGWADSHRSILEWRGGIGEALIEQDDDDWGSAELPADYIRVLREAGIYNGEGASAGSSPSGSGNSKASRNNK